MLLFFIGCSFCLFIGFSLLLRTFLCWDSFIASIMSGKRSAKRRHVLLSSSSSDDEGPIPARRSSCHGDAPPLLTQDEVQSMIEVAVTKALASVHKKKGAKTVRLVGSSSSESDEDRPSTSSGKFLKRDEMWDTLSHVRDNLGFDPPDKQQDKVELFPQYLKPAAMSMPFVGAIKDSVLHEWKDVDKAAMPTFLQKLYLIEGEDPLPSAVKVDSILATLIGRN